MGFCVWEGRKKTETMRRRKSPHTTTLVPRLLAIAIANS